MDDVLRWLKSIDLSILYHDITELKHLAALQVQELHCHKLLREINILRAEQKNA